LVSELQLTCATLLQHLTHAHAQPLRNVHTLILSLLLVWAYCVCEVGLLRYWSGYRLSSPTSHKDNPSGERVS
ncbi:hypothetical protein B0O99DRAFT_558624, partial [Bisporella sp. PMI_857]